MSITIEVNNKQINDENSRLSINFLPAKIKGDGVANVDKFFNNYTRKEDGVLTNALRGYPLQGTLLNVPDGYKGLVLQETRKPLDEEADRTLRIKGSFDEFTYWNYDKIPSQSDGYRMAMQMMTIADVLAEPITEADVLAEME